MIETPTRRGFLAALAALGGSQVLRRAEPIVKLATASETERFADVDRSFRDFWDPKRRSVIVRGFSPYSAAWLPDGWEVIGGFDLAAPRSSPWAMVKLRHKESGETRKVAADRVYGMMQSAEHAFVGGRGGGKTNAARLHFARETVYSQPGGTGRLRRLGP